MTEREKALHLYHSYAIDQREESRPGQISNKDGAIFGLDAAVEPPQKEILSMFKNTQRVSKLSFLPSTKLENEVVAENTGTTRHTDFSLFYFASANVGEYSDKYKLLIEGAKFADKHGFAAVWTPERHFHKFGGLYPNPSVTSAAIATITERIQIRAGSVAVY
jgi:hypothetical protein